MGCGGKQPQMQLASPPTLPSAEQLFSNATAFGKRESPLAYGARESALSDLGRGQDYYAGFQPTSFEQALGNQYFQNVLPGVQNKIMNTLSLSGLESSPVLARLLGEAQGNIGYDVGRYLSDQGNQRAQFSLQNRLGIDPFSTYGNYLNADMNQSNNQASLNYDYDQQRAQQDYQNALNKYQRKGSMISTLGTIGGGALGFAVGGPAGASLGASLGGGISPLFGGNSQPVGLGDALSIGNMFPKQGYGMNTPYGVQDMGTYSSLPRTAQPVWGRG